jgi:hypothetical protein
MAIDDALFDYLIKLKKEFKESNNISLGPAPIKWTRDIISTESKDTFLLDFYRGEINLSKYSINKRYRTSICLLRICSQKRHTNPDGTSFSGAHVHIYKSGYEDKIAQPFSILGVKDDCSMDDALTALLKYCNVKNIPTIQITL